MIKRLLYNTKENRFDRFSEQEVMRLIGRTPEIWQPVDKESYILRNKETGDFSEHLGVSVNNLLRSGFELSTAEREAIASTAKEREETLFGKARQFVGGAVSGLTLGLLDPIQIANRYTREGTDRGRLLEREQEAIYDQSGMKLTGQIAGGIGGLFATGGGSLALRSVGALAKPLQLTAKASTQLMRAGAKGGRLIGKKALGPVGGFVGKHVGGTGGAILPWAVGGGLAQSGSRLLAEGGDAFTGEGNNSVSQIMKNVIGAGVEEASESALSGAVIFPALGALGGGIRLTARGIKGAYNLGTRAIPQGLKESFLGIRNRIEKIEKLKKIMGDKKASTNKTVQDTENFLNDKSKELLQDTAPINTRLDLYKRLLQLNEKLKTNLITDREGFKKEILNATEEKEIMKIVNSFLYEAQGLKGVYKKQLVSYLQEIKNILSTKGSKYKENYKAIVSNLNKKQEEVKTALNSSEKINNQVLDQQNVFNKSRDEVQTLSGKIRSSANDLSIKRSQERTIPREIKLLRLKLKATKDKKIKKDIKAKILSLEKSRVPLTKQINKDATLLDEMRGKKIKLQNILNSNKKVLDKLKVQQREANKLSLERVSERDLLKGQVDQMPKPKGITMDDVRQILKSASELAHFNKENIDKSVIRDFRKFYGRMSDFEDDMVNNIFYQKTTQKLGKAGKKGIPSLENFIKNKKDLNKVLDLTALAKESMTTFERYDFHKAREFLIALASLGGAGHMLGGGVGTMIGFGSAFGLQLWKQRGYKYLQLANGINSTFRYLENSTIPRGIRSIFDKSNSLAIQLEENSKIGLRQLFYLMTGRKLSLDDNDLTDTGDNDHFLHDGDMSDMMDDYGGTETFLNYNKKNIQAKNIIRSIAPKPYIDQYGVKHPISKLQMEDFLTTVNQGFSYPQFIKSIREKTLTKKGFDIAMRNYPKYISKFNMALTEGLKSGELLYSDFHWYLQFLKNMNSNLTNVMWMTHDMDMQAQNQQDPATRNQLKRPPLRDSYTGTEV